jgi:hypothetical protein
VDTTNQDASYLARMAKLAPKGGESAGEPREGHTGYLDLTGFAVGYSDALMVAYKMAEDWGRIPLLVMLWNHRVHALNGANWARAHNRANLAIALGAEARSVELQIRQYVDWLQNEYVDPENSSFGRQAIQAELDQIQKVFGEMLKAKPTP